MIELSSKESTSSCSTSAAAGAEGLQTESVEEGFRRCAEMVVGAFSSEQVALATSPGLSALYQQLAGLVSLPPGPAPNNPSPTGSFPTAPLLGQSPAAVPDLVDGCDSHTSTHISTIPVQRSPLCAPSQAFSCAFGPRPAFEVMAFPAQVAVPFARPQVPHSLALPFERLIPIPTALMRPKPSPFSAGQPLPPLTPSNPTSSFVRFGSVYPNQPVSMPNFLLHDFKQLHQDNTAPESQQQQVTAMQIVENPVGARGDFSLPVDILANLVPPVFSPFVQPIARGGEVPSIPPQSIGHRPSNVLLNPCLIPASTSAISVTDVLSQPASDSNNNKHAGVHAAFPAATMHTPGAFMHNTSNKTFFQATCEASDGGGRVSALPAVSTILSPEPKRVPYPTPVRTGPPQFAFACPVPSPAQVSALGHVQSPYSSLGASGELFGQPQPQPGFASVPPWLLAPLPPVAGTPDLRSGSCMAFAPPVTRCRLPELSLYLPPPELSPHLPSQEMQVPPPPENLTSPSMFNPSIFK